MKPRFQNLIMAALLFAPIEAYAQADDLNTLVIGDGERDLGTVVAAYKASFAEAVARPADPDDSPFPYFARRQVTSCNSCHVAVPKLNTYGRLVKATGYELPELDLAGHEELGLKKFSRYIPLGFRGKVDFANGDPNDVQGGLDVRSVQLLGGGALFNNKVSWWVHTHVVEDNELVNPFDNIPHELWGQYNLSFANGATRVSLRGGMSELPLWFAPSKTKLTEISYAVYDAMVGDNDFMLSRPQFGVAVSGSGLNDMGNDLTYSWSLAAVNGEGDFSNARFTQIFGRFTKTFPNLSFGTFGYVGSQEIHEEAAVGELVSTDRFFRLGLDLDAYIGPFNVYALGLYGRNGNPSATPGVGAQSYFGGFVGTDLSVTERFIVSARYDGVEFSAEPEADHEDAGHDAHGAEPDGGHLHGEMVAEDTDTMVFGMNYMLTWQVRLTTEYRRGFSGLGNKWIAGMQFAF
jgi:hypothetical protein